MIEREFRSALAAPADQVWTWMTSVRGINRELWPYFTMTAPSGVSGLTELEIRPGQPLFRSIILLGGLLPIDRSLITPIEFSHGKGFVEQSPMLSMKVWRHERRLEPIENGTVLVDRLSFEPRFGATIIAWFMTRVFNHRHAVLKQTFGELAHR